VQPVKTSTVIAILLAVLLSFASVATAAGYLWSHDAPSAPPAARSLPAVWPSKGGQALRAVPIPTGEMIVALPPDTGGHVLCQALTGPGWETLLGGTALREVLGGGCHVVTDNLDLALRLDTAPATLQAPKPIDVAGHAGEVEYLPPEANTRLNVRLVPASPTEQIRPFLRVELSRAERTGPALDQLAESIAGRVVEATMAPGPALPARSGDQVIAARQEPPVAGHGIVDSPWPIISWQLCTALAGELGSTGKPRFDGRCTVRGIDATYTDALTPRTYPGTLDGRPALITAGLVAIKLTDDSAQELTFTGTGRSLRALAESVLPSLLGR
jgi:hypothetical protein